MQELSDREAIAQRISCPLGLKRNIGVLGAVFQLGCGSLLGIYTRPGLVGNFPELVRIRVTRDIKTVGRNDSIDDHSNRSAKVMLLKLIIPNSCDVKSANVMDDVLHNIRFGCFGISRTGISRICFGRICDLRRNIFIFSSYKGAEHTKERK